MTEPVLAPALRTLAESDIEHEVCCIDEHVETDRITMCGLPTEDGPLGEEEPDCVVCLELIERWAYYVDKYGEDPQRPDDTPCRVCPRRLNCS